MFEQNATTSSESTCAESAPPPQSTTSRSPSRAKSWSASKLQKTEQLAISP